MALTLKKVFSPSDLKMLALAASIFFVFSGSALYGQDPKERQGIDLSAASQLIEEHDFAKAFEVAKALTQKYPEDSLAWFYLGVSAVEIQHLKEGTNALLKSIELQPNNAPARTFLADALIRQNNFPEAVKQIDEVLLLAPSDPYANYTKALISFQQKQYPDAAQFAEQATLDKSDFAEAYLLRAQALIGKYQVFSKVDDTEKQNILSRYRSAADALTKYAELIPSSEKRTLWFEQIELLRSFPAEETLVANTPVDKHVQILAKPEPSYTEEARRYQIRGTVILRALFDIDGTVKKVFVCQALRGGLTENSAKAAAKIKFIPATLNGQPVATWMQMEYNFNLY